MNNMKNAVSITLTDISKRYFIHPEKPTFTENLNPFKKSEEFWALRDINLTVQQGERVGIIGPNGSGKTTLLKIISGVTKPTQGTVKTVGKVVSLIELTAGFHPDMNGIANIYLNGLILGMKKYEVDQQLKKIIDYADIGNFIHQPLFTYSSGMVLRLGSSIALHSNSDIYVFDESLSTGDREFVQKVFTTFETIIAKSATIVYSSHDLYSIKRLCPRSILLVNNHIVKDSNSVSIIKKYTNS